MRHGIFSALLLLVLGKALAAEPAQRTLSFQDRLKAQKAIARVYYSHQIGVTKPFEQAVPRDVLEAKVHKYLDETTALEVYWRTPVTDEMLQRELERMAGGTRMPERLLELYAALGNDPFLVKECLARATLVDRLAHNFYAFDVTLHAKARARAEELRRQLLSGELSARAEHSNRAVTQIVLSENFDPPSLESRPVLEQLSRDEFRKKRADVPAGVGQASAIREDSDSLSFVVLLSESPNELRIATYDFAKTSWDAWWLNVQTTLSGRAVTAVSSSALDLPQPNARGPSGTGGTCPGDDTWNHWILREVPTARRSHTAIWTGSVMVVWGGYGWTGPVNTGSRYDPATDTWLSTTTAGAPSARQLHRAVWTGASMVVWGGRGASNTYLGDGGRYDPIDDAWSPVSLTGAPLARSSFTAIWTGSRMVVWGGSNASGLVDVGGQYDPVNDTWALMSTVGAPDPRTGHTAVWTGSRMIVWGGFTSATSATGGQYDPANDSWTPTSTVNAPSARSGHSAVWTGNLMIVWGGTSGSGAGGTGGRYDPVGDTWTATSITNTPSMRTGQLAIWSGTSMIVWGGSLFDASAGIYNYPTDGGRYDPVGDSWTPTPALEASSGRSGHTLIWTGSSMIAWGGYRYETPEFTIRNLDTGARYTPSVETWTPTSLAGTPRARRDHSAIWTGNVMVIWAGSDGNTDFNTGGRYDPTIDDWAGTSTLNAPSGRYLHSTVWTGNVMVVWGGETVADHSAQRFDNGGAYNPTTDTWAPISTTGAPSKRCGHPTVWTGREMLVWGGIDGSVYPTTGGRYDPSTDTWNSMSSQGAPSGRYYASAVWTGRSFIVWGGYGGDQLYLNSGGRYDPVKDKWTATSPTGAPAGRFIHSTIWTGRAMIVWGGSVASQGGESQTGARYDPVADAWSATSTIGAPSARADHSAIWTGRDMVLWGGYGGGYLATGGRYDPNLDTWTPTSTAGAPSARTGHSAVWNGSEMLVWGGYENASPYTLVDTGGSYRATPGESCNGLDDDCDGLADNGGDALCNDGNPCTDDSCSGSGGCVFIANQNPCDDDDGCTAADTCGAGSCSGTPQTGTACDDGNACTTDDRCAGGQCTGGPPRVCDDENFCTDDSCDPATGCVVAPLTCDDANVCTDDSCDPATGCVFVPNTNACDDGSPCTTDESCQGGQCAAALPLCSDSNPCTDDICNPWGCSWPPNSLPCDDGDQCTVSDTCSSGLCNGTRILGTECDDGDACTSGDTCGNNGCGGTPRNCTDGNPCTDDRCDFRTGECLYFNLDNGSCSDGDACTFGESCHAGVCDGSTPVDCFGCPEGSEPDGPFCRETVNMNGDYLFNQSQTCDFDGTNRYNDCEGGSYGFSFRDRGASLLPFKIELQFISGVSCDSGISQVSLNGTPLGTFTPLGSCSCYPLRSLVSFPDIDVSAYLPGEINTFAIAPAGGCEGLTRWSDLDGYYGRLTITYARRDPRCAVGACDPATGVCDFSSFPDGTSCDDACSPNGSCAGGVCDAAAIDCDDHNACTTDSCDPAAGCLHVNNANPCDDGNTCTTGDTCSGGSCLGTPEPPAGEVVLVSASKFGTTASFEWDGTTGATHYDLLRGSLHDWPVGSNPATEECLGDSLTDTSLSDDTVPAGGDGYWYLVRSDTACASGSYGWEESQGVPTVPRTSATCP